ncbi:MAG: substrate-binding domain-containing protein [Chloroflexi bacterium]|nr:substrate-binding domain-containing protein [Chloroflexota bacterium]
MNRKSDKIGLLTNTPAALMTSFLAETITGLVLGAEAHNLSVTFYTCAVSRPGRNSHEAVERICRSREIGGVILVWSAGIDDAIDALVREGMPFVVVGRRVVDLGYPGSRQTTTAARTMLTRHLIALGHRRIAFIAYPELGTINTDRLAGYSAALRDERLDIDEAMIISARLEPDTGYHLLDQLLDRVDAPSPSAIFAFNDAVAAQMLQAAADRGLHVPNDIAVAGFGGLPSSASSVPPLTTVDVSQAELARRAVYVLVGRMDRPDSPGENCTVPVSLIVRASTNRR